MSKAPEHYRPFNREQAILGAPFGCKNGDKPTVTIWTDARLTGYVEDSMGFHGVDWNASGDALRNEWFRGCDLVMLPLGMCEGKPVFVGDKLEWAHMGRREQVLATPEMRDMDDLTWPRPEPEYPKTSMTITDRNKALTGSLPKGTMLNIVGATHEALERGTECLANAAIVRAIQDGDVVPTSMLEKVAKEVQKAYTQALAAGGGWGNDGGQQLGWLPSGGGGSGGGGSGMGSGSIVPVFVIDIDAIIKRVKEGE